jgi:hypothetical protein
MSEPPDRFLVRAARALVEELDAELKAEQERSAKLERALRMIVETSERHPGSVALDRCIGEIAQDFLGPPPYAARQTESARAPQIPAEPVGDSPPAPAYMARREP